jgi:formylglycine-generating enzyme required for sulfatase activity/Flp pilus assembly protein TadD
VAPDWLIAQQTAGERAGEERCDNGPKMAFCWCPPGKFKMGLPQDENPVLRNAIQVDVTLTHGFWMGKYEVTQEQYRFVTGEDPSRITGESLPVENVSWYEATAFCQKLTKMEREAGRLPQRWEYHLPTEAQWEYACRAGTTTLYSFGNDAAQLGDYAWYFDNADKRTRPVGQKKSNGWGLFDMHGNVGEWCRDAFQKMLPGGNDPEVKWKRGLIYRVDRGGGVTSYFKLCQSGRRGLNFPRSRFGTIGFRVALVPADDFEAFWTRGRTWLQKGENERAIADFSRAIELRPEAAQVYRLRGGARFAVKQYKEALADYDRALAFVPDQVGTHYMRARSLAATGDHDNALMAFDKAARLSPQNEWIYFYRGQTWRAKGHAALALIDFNKAVEVDPENASTHNQIAWLFATCPEEDYRNGEKAVELARKACELTDWKLASYMDTLAAAYAEAEDFDAAVKWQTKVLELAPDDEDLKARLRSRLELYRAKKPYRENEPAIGTQ